MTKSEFFRNKYPEFIYCGYSYGMKAGDLEILFDFALPPDLRFQPKIIVKDVQQALLNLVKQFLPV